MFSSRLVPERIRTADALYVSFAYPIANIAREKNGGDGHRFFHFQPYGEFPLPPGSSGTSLALVLPR
jgi:hypothetical protein